MARHDKSSAIAEMASQCCEVPLFNALFLTYLVIQHRESYTVEKLILWATTEYTFVADSLSLTSTTVT